MNFLYILARRSVYLTLGAINRIIPSNKTDVFILCYHSISNDGWAFSITPNMFKKQIEYLAKNHHFITLSELFDYCEGKKTLSKPSIVLTFDDGYRNILQIRNFLETHSIKPALFIIANTANANRKELCTQNEFLNKQDLLALIKLGWEIGSHSATHSNINTMNDEQIIEEIINSKIKLQSELKTPINYLAFPGGRYSEKILKTVQKAGYKMTLTMNDGKIYKGMNKFLIPRIGVDGTHSFTEFKTLFLPLNIKFRGFLKEMGYGK